MMETERPFETMVNFYQTTRRYNPEDSQLHTEGDLSAKNQSNNEPRQSVMAE
jgi:hypothetical protein